MPALPPFLARLAPAVRERLLLTAAVAVVYLATAAHPALGSSTRYGESCREMVELGQWMVPHLGYAPYFEKPILTYWLGCLSQWVFGGSDLATNLPAGVASLVSVLATHGIARRLRSGWFAVLTALLLLITGQFLAFVSTLTTDPVLAACLMAAWWCYLRWQQHRDSGRKASADQVGFWALVGLAMLAKGPIGVVLAGLAVGGAALVSGGWRELLRTFWALGPISGTAVILLVNLPWSWVMWQTDPRYLEYFYIGINFRGLFDANVNHPGPWWYYLPALAVALLPFAPLLVPAVVSGLAIGLTDAWRRLRTNPVRSLLLAGILLPLLFLSLISSKLETYLLPLLPLVVILACDQLAAWSESASAVLRWLLRGWAVVCAILAGALVAGIIGAVEIAHQVSQGVDRLILSGFVLPGSALLSLRDVDWSYLPLAVIALAGLAIAAVIAVVLALVPRRTLAWRVVGSCGALGLGALLLVGVVLPRIHDMVPKLDESALARAILARQQPGAEPDLVAVATDAVHDYEIIHTLKRRVAIVGRSRELGMGHFVQVTPPTTPLPGNTYDVSGETLDHPWLWSQQRLAAVWSGPQRVWLIGHADAAEHLRAAGLSVVEIDRVRRTILLSNRPDVP